MDIAKQFSSLYPLIKQHAIQISNVNRYLYSDPVQISDSDRFKLVSTTSTGAYDLLNDININLIINRYV